MALAGHVSVAGPRGCLPGTMPPKRCPNYHLPADSPLRDLELSSPAVSLSPRATSPALLSLIIRSFVDLPDFAICTTRPEHSLRPFSQSMQWRGLPQEDRDRIRSHAGKMLVCGCWLGLHFACWVSACLTTTIPHATLIDSCALFFPPRPVPICALPSRTSHSPRPLTRRAPSLPPPSPSSDPPAQ